MADNEGFAQPWLDFEKQVGFRPLLHGPVSEFDAQFQANGAILGKYLTFPTPDPSVKTIDKEISPNLKVRIYTPPDYNVNKPKPVAVSFHGGGWAMGDLDAEDIQFRTISKSANIVLVSVDYRLAPANPYPAALNDCITAYHWALKNTDSLNTVPNQAILFGLSAGANLALCTALKLIDEGFGSSLKGIVAVVPVTIDPEFVPEELKGRYTSYEEHAEHTVNTKKGMEAFYDAYQADGRDPYVSPLLHKGLNNLPKTYIAVAGHDTLRDDGRLFKSALDDAGVPNLYDEYIGYPHWFWAFPSHHLAEPTAEYDRNLKKGFEFVLS